MAFERIPEPFIRLKTEKEKKEGKFERPESDVSADFLSGFIRENFNLIKGKENGLLSLKFSAAASEIIALAEKARGGEYATNLERYILDDSKYWFIVPGDEDFSVKRKGRSEMIEDLRVRGVSEEEISRLVFEEELEEEKSLH